MAESKEVKIAIDSNRYTDFARGDARAIDVLQGATEIYIPIIVIAEQRAGFAVGTKREKNERILTQFLNTDGVFVSVPDEQTTFFYADVYLGLRKQGTTVPTNDIWIAALCLQHQLVLFTRDSDFEHIPQLVRI